MKPFLSISLLICSLLWLNPAYTQTWQELDGTDTSLALKATNISSIAVDKAGTIYAAARFGSEYWVAKWTGTVWTKLGNTPFYDAINVIKTDKHGNVYAAGELKLNGGLHYVAQWNGSSWGRFGDSSSLLNAVIFALAIDTFDNVYAGGNFSAGTSLTYVAKCNGTHWSQYGALIANYQINALAADAAGNLYAGGTLAPLTGSDNAVIKWTNGQWNWLSGLQANGPIISVALDKAGTVYAAGLFTNTALNYYVAQYQNNTWSELGGNNSLKASGKISSLATDPLNNVFAAGSFRRGTGQPFDPYYVAKFDGTSWTETGYPGSGFFANGEINCLATDHNFNVYAGGLFSNTYNKKYVAYWHDTSATTIAPVPGLNEDLRVSIFPNPSAGTINIRSNDRLNSVTVYNALGQIAAQVASTTHNTSLFITLPGCYIITVATSHQTYRQTVVVTGY